MRHLLRNKLNRGQKDTENIQGHRMDLPGFELLLFGKLWATEDLCGQHRDAGDYSQVGSHIPLAIALKNLTDKTVMVALNSADVGVGRTFEITVLDGSGAALPQINPAPPLAGRGETLLGAHCPWPEEK